MNISQEAYQPPGKAFLNNFAVLAAESMLRQASDKERAAYFRESLLQVTDFFEKHRFKAEAKLNPQTFADRFSREDGTLNSEAIDDFNQNELYRAVSRETDVPSFYDYLKSDEKTKAFFTNIDMTGKIEGAAFGKVAWWISHKMSGEQSTEIATSFPDSHAGIVDRNGHRCFRMLEDVRSDPGLLAKLNEKLNYEMSPGRRVKDIFMEFLDKYLKSFNAEVVPRIAIVEGTDALGKPKLVMKLNRTAMFQLGMLEDDKSWEAFGKMEEKYKVVDLTYWIHIPVEEGKSAKETLEDIPGRFSDSLACLPGWYSLPGDFVDADKKYCQYDGEFCILADVISAEDESQTGRRRVVVGISGPGVVNGQNEGSPGSIDKNDTVDYGDKSHNEFVTIALQSIGCGLDKALGHSFEGQAVLRAPQDYFFGVGCVALCPASLSAESNRIGTIAKRTQMSALSRLNSSEELALLVRKTSHIRIPGVDQEVTSVICYLMGPIPGDSDHNIWLEIAGSTKGQLDASTERNTEPQGNVIGFLSVGQGVKRGNPLEGSVLTAVVSAEKDTFSSSAEFMERQEEYLYPFIFGRRLHDLTKALGCKMENGRIVPASWSDPESVYEQVFAGQTLVVEDAGHFAFLGKNAQEVISWAISQAEKGKYDDKDFKLAAAITAKEPFPIVAVPCFSEKEESDLSVLDDPDILAEMTREQALLLSVSMKRYEKLRILLQKMAEENPEILPIIPSRGNWEWYKGGEARERVINTMDFGGVKDYLKEALERKIRQAFDFNNPQKKSAEYRKAMALTESWQVSEEFDRESLDRFLHDAIRMFRNAVVTVAGSNNWNFDENNLNNYCRQLEQSPFMDRIDRYRFRKAKKIDEEIRRLVIDFLARPVSAKVFEDEYKEWFNRDYPEIEAGVRQLIRDVDPQVKLNSEFFNEDIKQGVLRGVFSHLCLPFKKKLEKGNRIYKELTRGQKLNLFKSVLVLLRNEISSVPPPLLKNAGNL